jgi:hypothetical protein
VGICGHDAFAVIRETIREMGKVAIGRLVLTNREHIIALEAMDKGLMGTLLRYPYEVRDPAEDLDEIKDVKVTKDMLNLARHIVEQKLGSFEPDKFEDQYETALVELINQKRSGKPITPKERPRGENVVDLMEPLRTMRRRRCGRTFRSEEAGQEVEEGLGWPEGDADADSRQEPAKGVGGQEAGGALAQVGVVAATFSSSTAIRRGGKRPDRLRRDDCCCAGPPLEPDRGSPEGSSGCSRGSFGLIVVGSACTAPAKTTSCSMSVVIADLLVVAGAPALEVEHRDIVVPYRCLRLRKGLIDRP